MKRLAILALIVALAASAPTSSESNETSTDDKLIIDEDFFPNELKIFTAEHDIVSLLYPLNELNLNDEDEDSEEDKKVIFFVEADGNEYKGISVFNTGNVTKLLATGTSIAADGGENKIVYFGATDGIYIYNATLNNVEKYGVVTDSIIDIAKANGTDLIYILTDKNQIYAVTEEGTTKTQIDITGAKQIVLDEENNLYYYGLDKKPYVYNSDIGTKKVEGLPENIDYIKLLRPAFVLEDGVPVIVNDNAFIITANGSSWDTEIEFKTKPSAYAIEGTLIQYYAREKSIYEYNIVTLLLSDVVESLKEYFNDKKGQIEELATRSRADF